MQSTSVLAISELVRSQYCTYLSTLHQRLHDEYSCGYQIHCGYSQIVNSQFQHKIHCPCGWVLRREKKKPGLVIRICPNHFF